MITPPTARIGALIIMFSAISTSCWTCWTSLVLRVISDGAPKRLSSTWPYDWTLRKMPLRTSRPKPMATLALKNTAMIAAIISTNVTASMNPPVCRMYAVSPLATPLLMISAFSSGR